MSVARGGIVYQRQVHQLRNDVINHAAANRTFSLLTCFALRHGVSEAPQLQSPILIYMQFSVDLLVAYECRVRQSRRGLPTSNTLSREICNVLAVLLFIKYRLYQLLAASRLD